MGHFDDARTLVVASAESLQTLRTLHEQCLAEESVKGGFLIEVKSFMEHLRSALDYCARGLFDKYGHSSHPSPRIYFPYAIPPTDKETFRNEIVNRKIPGLLDRRPDIVDMLESYQYFGNTGNWLYVFMRITNENKHERLTPQVEKQHKYVAISATIPAGETLTIDLKRIQLGGGPDKPYRAVAGTWTGLEFAETRVPVMMHLENALENVTRIVDELAST